MRHKAYAPGVWTRDRRIRPGDDVLHSVLRPVHVNPHYAPQAQASVVGRSSRHHGWANPRKREEPALGSERTDGARLAVCHRFRKGEAWHVEEKEGGRGLRPCEDQESRFGCPHVESVVAEVGRRRLASNKLGTALQKERSGSSERGPSSERKSAGETVGGRVERNVRRESASPLKTGEDRRKAQGGERSSSSGRNIAKSGEAVAGPGL
jgi:hypothetical protein